MTEVNSVHVLRVSTKAEGPGALPGSPEERLMPRTTDAGSLAVPFRPRVSIFRVCILNILEHENW